MPNPLKHPIQYIKNEIRIQGFYSIYYFEHGKNFFHEPEKHNTWEMVYADRGQLIAITDGIGCALEEGQAIFHEPNEVHAHISNGEFSNNMLVISFISDSPAMSYFKKKTFTLDKALKTLLNLFMQEAKNELGAIQGDYINRKPLTFHYSAFGATQLMASYFEEFLIKLTRLGGEKIHADSKSRMIAKNTTAELIEDYLKKNIYSTLHLPMLCAHFHISKSQLSQLFKECTGKSIMQYFSDLKMREAKKLLRETNHSVGEIAEKLGYTSIHSFSRAFKNATGFSPRAYKDSIL